jgi:hopanoid biosynthesis associated protein HpnK
VLTSASLMVNEPGFAEAVEMGRKNPGLGVGLHLTLLCGHSALDGDRIPGLVNARREFSDSPARVGWRYFFDGSLREQLRAEIHAQFAKFRATGLELDHTNGHLHLHLHPTVFGILMEDAEELEIERMRLTWDPLWLNFRLASGRYFYRLLHATIYRCLSGRARPALQRRGIGHTPKVFGLLQDSHVTVDYVSRLLPHLPPGDSELYSHPSLDNCRHEFEALISPRIREQIDKLGLKLIRYQDL